METHWPQGQVISLSLLKVHLRIALAVKRTTDQAYGLEPFLLLVSETVWWLHGCSTWHGKTGWTWESEVRLNGRKMVGRGEFLMERVINDTEMGV